MEQNNQLKAQINLPIILNSLKQQQNQSEKSLFKNQSVQSQAPIKPYIHPSKQSMESAFPQIDQIRKFLKKGELLNTNTLKKLKEDEQINKMAKHDRSSASLYKISRHIDFPGEEDPKKAEIKRIYLSHKKQAVKPTLRHSLRKPNLSSQQVQTDQLQYLQETQAEVQYDNNYQRLHKPSLMTIDFAQEERGEKGKGRWASQFQIEEDAEQNGLLPIRKNKGAVGRVKAISTNQGYMDTYVHKMGKTQFGFRSSLHQYSDKFKEYQQQQTIFSKTIDVKPLVPAQETIDHFTTQDKQQKHQQKTQKTTLVSLRKTQQFPQFNKQESKKTQPNDSGLKSVTIGIQCESISMADEKGEDRMNISFASQNLRLPLIKEETSRRQESSLVPQQTDIYSAGIQSRSRQISKAAEQMLNLHPTSHRHSRLSKHNHKQNQQFPQRSHKKSYLVQVPSVHQLKVGQFQVQTEKLVHPIRQGFNVSEVDWLRKVYNPRNELLRDLTNFQIKKYQNGVYYGELSHEGKKNGKGVIFYFSGKIYEGQLVNDLKQGRGHQYYPDGSSYKGEFKEGLKNGKGWFQWANGQIYDGQWDNGRKTGSGMWTSSDGQSYMGEWKNDKVEGFGVFVMKNGSRYQGQFKNSLKNGVGTERFYNGQTYVGTYQKNRPNGEGQYYWANGDYYKGNFSNGLRHGNGYFKQGKSALQYRGQYQNDKKCGFGQINYGNNIIYIGNFENNYRHGYGELFEGEKSKYKGYWVNDRQVDDENQLMNSQKATPKKKTISVIKEQHHERQSTLPKALPRQSVRPAEVSNHKHFHSISPDDRTDGYKRSCGCNKKH